MKKSILFSVLVVGATLLQAQSITVHQTCGQNGQVVKATPPEAAQAVDLGLSVKWANMNVGAESPEDYGNYYAWGETVTKATYDWSTYFDTNDGGNTFTKYNNEGGKTVLDPEDDAAHVNWGGSWRMPTKAEWQELIDNCTWTWTTQNGVNGYMVTSNKAGFTDKFIFLPAAGYRSDHSLSSVGLGFYWSSSFSENKLDRAWDLIFGSGMHYLRSSGSRYRGHSVRPVLQPSSISYSSSANDTIRIYSNGCDDYQTFIGSHGSQLTMTANSDQWSHFVQWQDGNTDNPRTITTNGNADYTAYFEAPNFSVQVQSNDAARGRGYISKVVKGDTLEYSESVGSFEAGSRVFLAYQANYGYHFDKWSDGNRSQQRSFILTKDTTFTATFAKNTYNITKNAEHGSISGNSSAEYLDEVTLTVSSDYGYHFSKWSDGNTDNPRTITLTSDTTFTAQFVKNSYTISTNSANPEWGTTVGDTAALYLDEVEISAIPNYGYHFVRWNDYNTSNPRTVSVTGDKTYTATFAKNVYSITTNAEHGSISGNSSAEYLDFVTLTATPDYGYHFTQWSDGNTDNPRTIELTQDTTFTAEFAVDRSGTCGDNYALIWSYDPTVKALTITGDGALNSNYTFGVEAPACMQKLVIESGVSSVGDEAFKGRTTLKDVVISHGVSTIGDKTFYGCTELETLTLGANLQSIGDSTFNGCKRIEEITVYADRVIDITATTFINVGRKAYIYVNVPEGSLRKYQRDDYWSEFDLRVIGATQETNVGQDINVTPDNNSADVTWPEVANAATYELTIRDANGNTICTLVFNAQGQLQSIAFAAPGRAQATGQNAGFTFTVTGLDSGSQYGFTMDAKDSNGTILDTKSGTFTTIGGVTTNLDTTSETFVPQKLFENGQLFLLLPDGTRYSATGVKVE